MENVEQFLDQLLDEKGYTDLDEDVRNELKIDMGQRLMDQIDQAAINALSEEKAIELANKLDDPNFTNEQAAAFVQESGVDMERIALETMIQFRIWYLGDAKIKQEKAEAENAQQENAEA